jgi:hypothetical protein
MKTVMIAMTGAALALGGCTSYGNAEMAERSAETCFRPTDVTGWFDVDFNRFVIHTDDDEVFSSLIAGACPEVDFAQEIAIIPRSSSLICERDDATIVARNAAREQVSCRIYEIERLTPAQIAALPERARPTAR